MKRTNQRTPAPRLAVGTCIGALIITAVIAGAASAGERKFLVMLANSPKEFEGNGGLPRGGLINRHLVDAQYFDTASLSIGSFAEYWEEISYGDVTVTGKVTDWISLPWAIRPPLVTPVAGTPQPTAERISPEQYFDLNETGHYEYGHGEKIINWFDAVIIDLDGDTASGDNGPFAPGPGSFDQTPEGYPVWRPGERFVDMDGDDKWDGLDEANNQMDWDRNDRPDLLGPWIDLNDNNEADNSGANCLYLADSDNDRNPDCCPDGPLGVVGTCKCEPTQWEGPDGAEILDCNGNLIPDPCDVSPVGLPSAECRTTGWLAIDPDCNFCGRSPDFLPYEEGGVGCSLPVDDGIPDECQFLQAAMSPDPFTVACTSTGAAPETACEGVEVCTDMPSAAPDQRCEFDDSSNDDGSLDVVEPFENFLRRWDPCMFDPDVRHVNFLEDPAHWVKVYDPSSPAILSCLDPPAHFAYAASTTFQPRYVCRPGTDCSLGNPSDPDRIENSLRTPSYIENNYPGDYKAVEEMAQVREIWGSHDPDAMLDSFGLNCYCADGSGCVPLLRLPGGAEIVNACPAGVHVQYDPPDMWENVNHTEDEGALGTEQYSTKMQAAPGRSIGAADLLSKWTPEPGELVRLGEDAWYEQAWKDRYVGSPEHPLAGDPDPWWASGFSGCENPEFDSNLPPGPANEPRIECEAPPWPQRGQYTGNIHRVVPFEDANADGYELEVNRRFFSANAGGLNGDGTGWLDCGDVSASVIFETGELIEEDICFINACADAPILPEEDTGASQVAIFYDGWVEHDDLPSSKYHQAGDQRLGEVTSPSAKDIWGEDRGDHNPNSPAVLDGVVPAAGPYAQHIHGNFGRDAGNLLAMELLTWRTEPPFNNGTAWEVRHGGHPYAGPAGSNLGFRDYNLDGLIDQGEVRPAGSENYVVDANPVTANNGTNSRYPNNRRRLLEDCVEVLDLSLDFDDFVDAGAMNAATNCTGAMSTSLWHSRAPLPIQFASTDPAQNRVEASGITSGIVMLPPGSEGDQQLFPLSPWFYPIHTEDGLADPEYLDANLPRGGNSELSWHLFFHDLVKVMPGDPDGTAARPYDTPYAAHEYGHAWERFPDLYDYDIYAPPGTGVQINCPVATWDIMASGGLVHPNPVLKESSCTEWVDAVDLTTVLTPGVESVLTLPPAEFVRDDSYFFLENENRPGERLYLWSAGTGFDQPGHPGSGGFPGPGVLIMHTNNHCANPEACSPQQNTPPFSYVIVQADGLNELEDGAPLDSEPGEGGGFCGDVADDGDPWPGSTGNTVFNCDSIPPSRWYTENTCSGLEITDVVLDGAGGALVTLKWTPTSIPSLEFIDPPGGVSVRVSPSFVRYRIKFKATDVYGGTTVHLYYTEEADPIDAIEQGKAHLIDTMRKLAPGTVQQTMDWNISGVADGRYYFFAKLVPGLGADGREIDFTEPRAGRNNIGQGTLTINRVDIAGNKARSETWTLKLDDIEPGGDQVWAVNGTLSQPKPEDDSVDPAHTFVVDATTRQGTYTSVGGEIKLTLKNTGTTFDIGDRWSFVTTGITDMSRSVTIDDGEINEAPTAVIFASPVAGPPPLAVDFDGRESLDPNGSPLTYRWDFGDGSAAVSGATPRHTFYKPGTSTVVLQVTNTVNGLSDDASVDIEVTNNSPRAVISAAPTSGGEDLRVNFSGGQSTDTESDPENLVYQWEFGDGQTANDAGDPGVFIEIQHTYLRDADGKRCTQTDPCTFVAKLTVTDEGGKTDVDTIGIQVGNSIPVPSITYSTLQGPAEWEVVFNAINSQDPDGDEIHVDWVWGDGEEDLNLPLTGVAGATDGSVPHIYKESGTYRPEVTLRDGRGGEAKWSGVTVTVSEATIGGDTPRAIFTVDPDSLSARVNETVSVDGGGSYDRPKGSPDSKITRYIWDWGDGTAKEFGVRATHKYAAPGTFRITLTVEDNEDPPNVNAATRTIFVSGDVDEEPTAEGDAPIAVILVDPEDKTGFAGATEFNFDGRESTDPDGGALAFRWGFGDGSPPVTTPTATHVYAEGGSYTVRLTVWDDTMRADVATETITIESTEGNRSPTAYIGSGRRSGAAPVTIMFDGRASYDPDGDDLLFVWEFHRDDGTLVGTSNDDAVVWTFTVEGTYTVDLRVSDGRGGEDHAGPEVVVVSAAVAPDDGGGFDQPTPGDGSDGGSDQPGGLLDICGLGMVMSLFGSLLGLSAMRFSRRRLLE